MSQSLTSYLMISAVLFCLGLYGLLARRNLIAMFISLELILNSVSINFLAFNKFCMADKVMGQVFALFIIALAAAEVSIGLSLVLWLYWKKDSINIENANDLKG